MLGPETAEIGIHRRHIAFQDRAPDRRSPPRSRCGYIRAPADRAREPTVRITSGIISRTISAARALMLRGAAPTRRSEIATVSTPSAREHLAGGAHVLLVQRRADRAVRQHPLAHAAPQIARHQHRRGRIFRIVAIAVFLVAEADLDANPHGPPCRSARSCAPLCVISAFRPTVVPLMHRSQFDTIMRGRHAEVLGDQRQPVLDGQGRVLRRATAPCKAAPCRSVSASTKSVKVPPASMPSRYSDVHGLIPLISRPRRDGARRASVAAMSTCQRVRVGDDDAVILPSRPRWKPGRSSCPRRPSRPVASNRVADSRRRRGSCW